MMKILIADDSPIHRAGLSRLVERMRYAVIQACDGGEAVELNERERPQLVLIDVMRPMMDGYAKFATENLSVAAARIESGKCGENVVKVLRFPCRGENSKKVAER